MNVHGYELITEWKNSQCGQTAKAKRGGKVYFLKKYQTPVNPVRNGALDERTFQANKVKFEKYVANRRRVNVTLRTIAGAGGNIIIPAEEFVEDNHYMEASEFIEGGVPDKEIEGVLSSLSLDVKKLLLLTATGALISVHGKGIVHSDLKLKNVLLAKNSSGNYVSKLIDFDSSYFLDDKPDEVVGDINYYSPELGSYADIEDEEERREMASILTEKSDIFSLGLIFHYYLSGELPEAKSLTERLQKRKDKGKVIYCWTILNNDCELKLSSKITNLKYLSLITDMLEKDPAKRPSATQVLQRLKAPDAEGVIEEPWPDHNLIVDKNKIKNSGYPVFRKITVLGKKKYELISKEGRRSEMTPEELVSAGFARLAREEKFDSPWEEHNITLNEAKLRLRGFVYSDKETQAGVKGYRIYRSDSTGMFFRVEQLIAMGYATKRSEAPRVAHVEAGFCEPWEEHRIAFDTDMIKRKGYVRAERTTISGVKGYNFFRSDGAKQFIKAEMLVVFKMARKI